MVEFGNGEGFAFLLTEALAGTNAAEAPMHRRLRITERIALELRQLHSLDPEDCPFDRTLDRVLPLAAERAVAGQVDESSFDPERIGRTAIDFVANFAVRHAIISIAAVDAATGLMDYHLAEAEFARMVLRCGQQRTVVTDHSKFTRSALVKVCDFDEFDLLVTDARPPSAIIERLEASSTALEVAATGPAP